ncbi:LamB/YcsF family protein [Micromonospora sp. CPCC 206061]|uniref:LamB/YcsF family protein n=1 Tax=Micromonospora sp. CPCC 206061 TaxID=3122410 RepID=UPI002FF0D82D
MDLNADLGEGFGVWRLGDDEALLSVVTSANVACGFHAGDPPAMRRVCAEAAARGVAVGAQVGYRDLAGFGRRRIEYAFGDLRDDVLYQIGALDGFCRVAGSRVRYVKPHGALYNVAAVDEVQAAAVVAAVVDYDRSLPVLCPPGSVLAQLAAGAGLRAVGEGFADRGYQSAGTLVPRSAPGALVTSPDEVAERVVRMATASEVVAVDGTVLRLPVESICLHGDTPGAVDLARHVRSALAAAGVAVTPFSRGVEAPQD